MLYKLLKKIFFIAAIGGATALVAADRWPEEHAQSYGKGTPDGSVADAWASVKNLKGNARRGRGLYEQSCMVCHGARGGNDGEDSGKLKDPFVRFDNRVEMGKRPAPGPGREAGWPGRRAPRSEGPCPGYIFCRIAGE